MNEDTERIIDVIIRIRHDAHEKMCVHTGQYFQGCEPRMATTTMRMETKTIDAILGRIVKCFPEAEQGRIERDIRRKILDLQMSDVKRSMEDIE